MIEVPWRAMRRLAPDPVQFQIILGSLLGDGRLIGDGSARRLRIAHAAGRRGYVLWKYERLGALVADAPFERGGSVSFTTVAHPFFDDLAALPRRRLIELVAPLGLAVWMTDLGRLEMRPDAFLPTQRTLALAG